MQKLILTFLYLSLTAVVTYGQTTAKVEGLVLDQRNFSPIAGATVTVVGTGYVTITDNQGFFLFQNLPAGEYQLRASSIGYASAVSKAMTVTQDVSVSLEIKLRPLPIPLPELTVSAKRDQKEFEELPSPRAVLTEEQIRRYSASNLSEVLNSLPGVYVQQAGPNGSLRVSIRGSASDQVLILLNGVKITSAQTGEADLNSIPVNQVKRVEIIKGAQTAGYGADALAGVILISTNTFALNKSACLKARNKAGSFGNKLWELGLEKSVVSGLSLAASGNRFWLKGDFTYPDSGKIMTRTNSGQRSSNLYWNLNWAIQDRHQVTLTFFKYFARRQLPGPLLQLNDSAYTKDRRVNLAFNSTFHLSSSFALESKAGYQDWGQTYHINEQYYIPVSVDYINRQLETETRFNFIQRQTKLGYGLSYLNSSLEGDDHERPALSIGKVDRNTFSSFLLAQQNLHDKPFDLIVISSALRYDKTSGFYHNWSPQIGILLSQGERVNLKLRANWGKAYHHPTLNALFWKEDAYAAGNPDLKPERTRNVDAGIELRLALAGELLLGQSYFDNKVNDLIVWQRRFDGKYSPSNINKVTIEGYEQYFVWRSPGEVLELEFNHTRSDVINKTQMHTKFDQLVPFRPRHMYNFKYYFKSEKLDVYLQSRYASQRYTREQNTKDKRLSAYTIWDLGIKFKHQVNKLNLILAVNVYNFTDQDYQLIERYPMPGREFRLATQIEL